MWPFSRNRVRAQAEGGLSATEVAIEALGREAGGEAVTPASLAVAEACIGLWERALSAATVRPASLALRGVSPACLALAGRMLALQGNAVFLVEVESGGVVLHPAAGWDPRGGYRPESRRYYLTMSGPDSTTTRLVHADAVLHFKVNATAAEWWRGQSPLRRSRATASLAAEVEGQLRGEMKFPPSRIIRPNDTRIAGYDPENVEPFRQRVEKGGVGLAPYGLEGEPLKVRAEPVAVMEALRSQVGHDICAAFGISPALFNPAGDGSGQRESWRRFWAGTAEPLGRMVEGELRAKLDPRAAVAFEALRASDEDGRSRAISRRAAAFKTFMDAGIGRAEALRLAGIEDAP